MKYFPSKSLLLRHGILHEYEAERDPDHLHQAGHLRLGALLLQDLEEDDVEQAAGGDALDQSELSIVTAARARPMAAHLDCDECGGVDVVLLAGVRQRHADPDADGGDGAEHRHVHHRDHRPQLHTAIYISRYLHIIYNIYNTVM